MKTFRILKNNLSKEAENSDYPYRYRIEQRHTILFFIHFWSSPDFAPPHNFKTPKEADSHIREHCPRAFVKYEL